MKKTILFNLFAATFLMLNSSCSEDCDHLLLEGRDAYIASCYAQIGSTRFQGTQLGDSIVIYVPDYVDTYELSVKFEIPENATVSPLPETVRDWSIPQKFKVSSYNQNFTKEYTITIAQSSESRVFEGSVRIGSQTELNNFFYNEYTEVQSIVLYGGGSDPIKDLSTMSSLKRIPGDLTITHISAREIVLKNLEVAGNVQILSPLATRISFPKLQFVAERFRVGKDESGTFPEPHPELEEVYLPELEYVGSSFILYLCDKLESLKHFSKLKHVGKDLKIDGGVFTTLEGLESITKINGNLELQGELASFDGFNIESVDGQIRLFCEDVTDLSALSKLKHIGIGISLMNNRYLNNLEGLENIVAPVIEIENFLSVETLEGFPAVNSAGLVMIKGMPKLTDISALSNLQRTDGGLYLQSLESLTNLNGLHNLEHVGTNFVISFCPKLEDISALSNLTNLGGTLSLSKLDALTDLSAFSNLTQIGGIAIDNMLSLEKLDGFHNITKISDGTINIMFCKMLTDLTALGQISEVVFSQYSDRIQFIYNDMLESFTPIGDLLQKYQPENRVRISGNLYNPSTDDIINGKFEP